MRLRLRPISLRTGGQGDVTDRMPLRKRGGRRRGISLLETLISALAALLIGAAILMLFQATIVSSQTSTGQTAAYADARRALNVLSDRIRNAQMVSGTGAFSAASTSSITCYTDSTGANTAQYWLDTSTTPGSLKQTIKIGASSAVTTILHNNVQSLTFTYYVGNGSNFTSSTWAKTANPNAPTAAELPTLGAIQLDVNSNDSGRTRPIQTLIRLRNSPNKPH